MSSEGQQNKMSHIVQCPLVDVLEEIKMLCDVKIDLYTIHKGSTGESK